MAKKASKPTSRDLEAMPWQEFVLGFQIATEALERLHEPEVAPPFMPAGRKRPRDPFVWTSLALAGRFGRDYPHLRNFHYRFWALMELLDGGHTDRWVTKSDEQPSRRLHPALLLAASEVKLTKNMKFPIKRFAARVEEIIRTEAEPPGEADAAAEEEEKNSHEIHEIHEKGTEK